MALVFILLTAVSAVLLKDTIGIFSGLSPGANLRTKLAELRSSAPAHLHTLGEVYLFGVNLADFIYDPTDSFVGFDGRFRRDFPQALGYFLAAKYRGNIEADFYIAFLLHQAYVVAEFEEIFEKKQSLHFFQSYQAAIHSKSRLVQSTVPHFINQCLEDPISPPSFLKSEEVEFFKGPFRHEVSCGGQCKDNIQYFTQEASDTVDFIISNGVEVKKPRHLGELDSTDASISENTGKTKLLKESLALDRSSEYVSLAQERIRGNPQAGLEPDYAQALRYYELAAAQGNLHAIETLGLMHGKGLGTEKNSTKSLELMRRAADAGSLTALSQIAYMLYNGEGVEVNKTLALEIYVQAASKGHMESIVNAGILYMSDEGIPPDYNKALLYLTAGMVDDHYNALFNLGLMYSKGLGVEIDCEVAKGLFYRVILKSEASTLAAKAYKFYRDGDFLGAYLYYALAAFMGVESAQISAGLMWERGQVPLTCKHGDENCAASYYMQALQQHSSDWAAEHLGDMEYRRGNFTSAYDYYLLSNSAYSMFSLGYLAQEGLGRPKSLQEAELWYTSIDLLASAGLFSLEESLPGRVALQYVKVMQWPLVQWVLSL
jgi:TPR repeat protein